MPKYDTGERSAIFQNCRFRNGNQIKGQATPVEVQYPYTKETLDLKARL